MKYKLKEHVTDEMLIECGFDMDRHLGLIHGTKPCDNYDGEIYVILTWGMKTIQGDELIIQWNDERENDITPYIQDLIDLNYVEVVECKKARLNGNVLEIYVVEKREKLDYRSKDSGDGTATMGLQLVGHELIEVVVERIDLTEVIKELKNK